MKSTVYGTLEFNKLVWSFCKEQNYFSNVFVSTSGNLSQIFLTMQVRGILKPQIKSQYTNKILMHKEDLNKSRFSKATGMY